MKLETSHACSSLDSHGRPPLAFFPFAFLHRLFGARECSFTPQILVGPQIRWTKAKQKKANTGDLGDQIWNTCAIFHVLTLKIAARTERWHYMCLLPWINRYRYGKGDMALLAAVIISGCAMPSNGIQKIEYLTIWYWIPNTAVCSPR